MFMACSFGGVGAIPPRDSVTSIRVGLAPARIRSLSRRFQSPWKIANVVVGLYLPQQWPIVINLTAEHKHLLQLLGNRYAWFYR